MIILTPTLIVISTFLPMGLLQKIPYRRPCALSDLRCIRLELSRYSNCDSRVWGFVPNELQVNDAMIEAPKFNATFIDQYTVYRNLDKCYVSAFFFNTDKNRMVFALTCPNIWAKAYRGVIEHNPLRQNDFYSYQIEGTYPPIIFTVDLPNADDIDICDYYIFPYLSGLPTYKLSGDNAFSSNRFEYKDGNTILEYFGIFDREEFSQKAGFLFRYWVNNVICNFNDFCTN